jgi:hypothetical protein
VIIARLPTGKFDGRSGSIGKNRKVFEIGPELSRGNVVVPAPDTHNHFPEGSGADTEMRRSHFFLGC